MTRIGKTVKVHENVPRPEEMPAIPKPTPAPAREPIAVPAGR